LKKAVIVLVITNLATLAWLAIVQHNLDAMYSLAEFNRKLKMEFLAESSRTTPAGYTNVYAAASIFRTLEDCVKFANTMNEHPDFPGQIYSCKEYQH